jgi:hypothetical protein
MHHSDQPHVQLFRVIRYGDHPGAFDGLDLRHRLAIYADLSLGAPRELLNSIRPNLVYPSAGGTLEYPAPVGYMGGPFHARRAEPPSLPAESMIYSRKARGLFRFDGPPLNSYQGYFIRKTIELARQHNTGVVVLHLPSPAERGVGVVLDREGMKQLIGDEAAFAGVPSARLFENVPPNEFEDYYQDEHLNRNGMELLSRTVTPALVQLYERFSQTR